ncbi:thioredoxin domain-containing protein 17-like [Orbicella faveolata]|uniref:thioredoxin domain-containing protein 17-like n=1 Tax=Orbicella faveolata TaxID=48498 RepID=UPI0009E2B641|nr:thioredoxin domain-containing protein 17-like [Orbicella faveolata]
MSEPKQLQLQVEGLSNLMATLKEHEGKRRTVMFIGSMNESGESWCPDCREVEPVVEAALQQASSDLVFILVIVGDKPEWKSPENEFRKSEFKLTEIPTIVDYGTDKRLGCEDCKIQDKVDKFFSN